MTLDEAIKHAEEIAEENQRVVDTKDVTIDMLFCDDEEIEEHLANYQKRAEDYRQLAKWLRDYKRLKEQEPCEDCISRQAVLNEFENDQYHLEFCIEHGIDRSISMEMVRIRLHDMPPVTPQPKTGYWIKISPAGIYECSECGQNVMTSDICAYKFCHGCGKKMEVENG